MEPIKRTRIDDLIWRLNKKNTEINSLKEEIKTLKQDYEQSFNDFKGIKNPEKLNNQLKLKLDSACSLIEKDKQVLLLCESHNETRQNYYNYRIKCKQLKTEIEAFLEQLNFDLNFLYSFRSKNISTELCIFDINKRRTEYVDFKLNQELKCFDSWFLIIELPNSQLFCYWPSQLKSNSLIIDIKTYQIKKILQSVSVDSINCGIYYKNSIFLFSSSETYNYLNIAICYDLNHNRWVKIPNFIPITDDCSCTVYKGSIFLCGSQHNKLYRYDLNINSYSELDVPELQANFRKNLLIADSKICIIIHALKHRIIFCESWAKISWFCIEISNLPVFDGWIVKYSKGSIYFWHAKYRKTETCYKFSMEKRKIEEFYG